MSKFGLFQAKEQEVETKKAVNKMVHGNVTKGKVEEKLKYFDFNICFFDHRETEEELEVIWQAAVTENDKMKEVVKNSLKKLRQHENLSDLMDKEESRRGESQLVYISSDGDE
ncbi:hypothetical protein KUTeg_019754 [Tegillarca granosa]|uniref:Uncharacterized protein n=1 Tax=Tegillarca granosa TaxID=220873 RepID=A0ABQ9EJG0_TEGGR|nr:hypothetical protein KUTeg_019754 [Tegillarca granosa]